MFSISVKLRCAVTIKSYSINDFRAAHGGTHMPFIIPLMSYQIRTRHMILLHQCLSQSGLCHLAGHKEGHQIMWHSLSQWGLAAWRGKRRNTIEGCPSRRHMMRARMPLLAQSQQPMRVLCAHHPVLNGSELVNLNAYISDVTYVLGFLFSESGS